MNADYVSFRNEVFDIAKKRGLEAAELYTVAGESFRASALGGELAAYHVANTLGVSLRVKADGKTGYAYTEALSDAEALLKKAHENALCTESDDEQPMTGAGLLYAEVSGYSERINEIDEKQKIALALDLEQKALKADDRVKRVQSCSLSSGVGETLIENTLGLSVSFKSSRALAYVTPVVVQGDEVRDGFSFRLGQYINAPDFDDLAREAVAEALCKLGSGRYPSGRSPVVLRNDVAASLLAAFSPVFSAYEAQKGLSLLNNREDERIGGEILTIIDDPHMKNGYASAPFDAEGTPTMPLTVVENGVLRSLLHNLRTARKAGATKSTGHAGKASPASPVDVSPTNFHIQNGAGSVKNLLETLGNGLFIIDISGLHAGVNPISGDFSLLARGFAVENGKCARPVEQLTLAGNFFELLGGVKMIAEDLFFSLPGGKGCAGSPSLLVDALMVAGE